MSAQVAIRCSITALEMSKKPHFCGRPVPTQLKPFRHVVLNGGFW